jgi:hypothetical protein
MTAAETLAKLHSVVPEDVGLGSFGPRSSYCRRQVGRPCKAFIFYHDHFVLSASVLQDQQSLVQRLSVGVL